MRQIGICNAGNFSGFTYYLRSERLDQLWFSKQVPSYDKTRIPIVLRDRDSSSAGKGGGRRESPLFQQTKMCIQRKREAKQTPRVNTKNKKKV